MVPLPAVERTPDGRRLVVDRVVDADPDAVWDVLTDTRRWPDWGPSVSDVRSPVRHVEAGTRGEVQVFGGPGVSFEVRTCRDRRWTWRVARTPATGHRVEPELDGARIAFEVPLAASGYAVVRERALTRIQRLVEG